MPGNEPDVVVLLGAAAGTGGADLVLGVGGLGHTEDEMFVVVVDVDVALSGAPPDTVDADVVLAVAPVDSLGKETENSQRYFHG